MRKILIIAVGLVLVSAVAMSADIPERRILNAVYDPAKEVLRIDLSDTAVAIPGGVNATLTDTAFTGKLPADIKPFVFVFYDTTTAGTVTFTGVLKNIGITSGGAVTDSATIFINGVQYDCLLGGEDSGEGLEGYLLNPVIRWELYGVDRIRIKMSGYQN